MTTPERLDQLISEKHKGENALPQTTEEELTTALIEFAQGFQLDPELDAHLKSQFQVKSIKSHLKIHPILRLLAVSVATFMLIAVTILTVPPLRSIAQEIIDTLFPRSENQTQVMDHVGFESEDIITYSMIEDARNDIEFDVRIPSNLPAGSEINSIYYYAPRNTLTIQLQNIDDVYYLIYQQPLANAQANGYFTYTEGQWVIGQDAESQTVMIGDITGEFIRGSWVTNQRGSEAVYRWSDTFPIFTLRWISEEILYQLEVFMQPDDFDLDAFIALAENIMR